MIVTHAGTDWRQPLCGNDMPDSSGSVTTHRNYERADCPDCREALGLPQDEVA